MGEGWTVCLGLHWLTRITIIAGLAAPRGCRAGFFLCSHPGGYSNERLHNSANCTSGADLAGHSTARSHRQLNTMNISTVYSESAAICGIYGAGSNVSPSFLAYIIVSRGTTAPAGHKHANPSMLAGMTCCHACQAKYQQQR